MLQSKIRGGEKASRECPDYYSKDKVKEKSALVRVKYLDHVLFRNCNPAQVKPNIREVIGWLISETPEALCVCSDLSIEPLENEKTIGSGLVILKSDVVKIRKLEIDKAFKHSNIAISGQKKPYKMEKRKMQMLNNAGIEVLSELQNLEKDLPLAEKKAREYIVNSFTGKMPSLIPLALENTSVVKLASYLLKYTTGSKHTLYQYVFGVHRFSKWLGKTPDRMVEEALTDKTAVTGYVQKIDDFIGELQAENLAPGGINNHVKGVKALFRANSINLTLPYRVPKKIRYPDRSPTPEELSKLIGIANLRDKVIVSILALSGVRIGTLVKLEYRHVKCDLERGVDPVHMHIEAEITKGKYHEYDTFIGAEGVELLKAYLKVRRIGNERLESGHKRGMPPEEITDSSPLIRNEHKTTAEPISTGTVHRVIHVLYRKAGLIEKSGKVRYDLRAHSIRKFFRTQLGANSSIPTDYIEYMMGHTISAYNDIKMKGVEFLRNLYASSGLGIRPRTRLSKIEQLKIVAESLGLNPDEVLSNDAQQMPHRTIVDTDQRKIVVLNQALKSAIIEELKKSIF